MLGERAARWRARRGELLRPQGTEHAHHARHLGGQEPAQGAARRLRLPRGVLPAPGVQLRRARSQAGHGRCSPSHG